MEWNDKKRIDQAREFRACAAELSRAYARVIASSLLIYVMMQLAAIIPNIITAIELAQEAGTNIGTMVECGFVAVSVFALFRMGRFQDKMLFCAGLSGLQLAAQIVLRIVYNETMDKIWVIASMIICLLISYLFMNGCSDLLYDNAGDQVMSDKWRNLWKCYIGVFLGGLMLIFALYMLLLLLGRNPDGLLLILPMLVWAAILVALKLKEYIYIFRTMKIFWGIAENS